MSGFFSESSTWGKSMTLRAIVFLYFNSLLVALIYVNHSHIFSIDFVNFGGFAILAGQIMLLSILGMPMILMELVWVAILFQIGSISKVFTTTLLSSFVLDNTLHLEDNIQGYAGFNKH